MSMSDDEIKEELDYYYTKRGSYGWSEKDAVYVAHLEKLLGIEE